MISLHFDYADSLSNAYTKIKNGRKAFLGIHSESESYLNLSYGISNDCLNKMVIYNYLGNENLTLTLNSFYSLSSTSRNRDYSRNCYISSVKDNNNRRDSIIYYATGTGSLSDIAWRQYTNGNINGGTYFYFDYFPSLIKEINYHSRNFTNFSYYGRFFDGTDHSPNCLSFAVSDPQNLYSGVLFNSKLTFRDCFANYMIKDQVKYDTSKAGKAAPDFDDPGGILNSRVISRHYDYMLRDLKDTLYTKDIRNKTKFEGIRTIITENGKNADDNKITVQDYVYARTNDFSLNFTDRASTIKMVQDSLISGNDRLVNNTYYNFGKLLSTNVDSWQYYDGSFYEDSVLTKKHNIALNYFNISRVKSIYQDTTITFWLGSDFGRKHIWKSLKKISPQGLVSYTEFINIAPGLPLDNLGYYSCYNSNYYYKLKIPVLEKTYNGNLTKDYKTYEVQKSGSLIGSVSKITFNPDKARQKYIKIFNRRDNFLGFDGLTDSVVTDNNLKQTFSYAGQPNTGYLGYAPGKIVQYNGTVTNCSFYHLGYQYRPFQTTVSDGKSSFTQYTSYKYGKPEFEVDINGLHSAFAYDRVGRLTTAALPGSFIYDKTSFVNGLSVSLTEASTYFSSLKLLAPNGSAELSFSITEDRNGSYGYFDQCLYFPDDLVQKFGNAGRIVLQFRICGTISGIANNNAFTIEGLYYKTMVNNSLPLSGIKNTVTLPTLDSYTDVSIDVTNIVRGTSACGLCFYTRGLDEPNSRKYFAISGSPRLILLSDQNSPDPPLPIDQQPGITGTIVYSYNDTDNSVEEQRRTNSDPNLQLRKSLTSKENYDGLGQLRTAYVKNDLNTFEQKAKKSYTYTGKVSTESDALGRKKSYLYDGLDRVIQVTSSDSTGNNPVVMKTEYFPKSGTLTANGVTVKYFEWTKTTDEENKTVTAYFDSLGNKVAENAGSVNPVIFVYNGINLLTKVISPSGKVKQYYYDELNNLSKVYSPADEPDTVKYKYDKYGRLRFSTTNGATQSDRGITFTKYDSFGRQVATGTLPPSYTFDKLDADKDYSIDQQGTGHFEHTVSDTSNFVVVNMYDSYNKSGIFAQMQDPFSWSQSDTNSSRNLTGKLVLTAFRDRPGQGWNYKIYLYDCLGHVSHHYVKLGSNPWKFIFKEEDVLGNQKRENIYKISGGSSVGEFFSWNNYDMQGRLLDVRTDMNGNYSTAKTEATYTYNTADQCSTLIYNQVTGLNNKTTYTYHPSRGWLSNISNGSSNFTEGLLYYNNGDISTQSLTSTFLGSQTLSYSYDNMHRLMNVISGPTQVETFQYIDDDGNFSYRGYLGGGSGIYYHYTPGTNRLSTIDLNGQSKAFRYDYKGNVTYDESNSLTNITYDHRNLPLSMTVNGSSAKYSYNDHGERIYKDAGGKKEYYLKDDTGRELAVYDAVTDKLKMINLYGAGNIGRIDVSWTSTYDDEFEEWIETRSDTRLYYIKDHLGSTRQTLGVNGGVLASYDYFAFGQMRNSHIEESSIDKYLFTGKERDNESGLDYFGARYYDSRIGRWMSIDPLADKYPGLSPYNYCMNNPLYYIDPDGRDGGIISIPTTVIVGGAIFIATAGHTYNYLTNSEYRRASNSFAEGLKKQVNNSINEVVNGVKKFLNSDSSTEKNNEEAKDIKEQAEQIANEIGKNSVTLPDGQRVDLKGRGHTDKSKNEKIETPHTHDVITNTNPETKETYTKTKKVPRPTTQEDIDKVKKHLKQ